MPPDTGTRISYLTTSFVNRQVSRRLLRPVTPLLVPSFGQDIDIFGQDHVFHVLVLVAEGLNDAFDIHGFHGSFNEGGTLPTEPFPLHSGDLCVHWPYTGVIPVPAHTCRRHYCLEQVASVSGRCRVALAAPEPTESGYPG